MVFAVTLYMDNYLTHTLNQLSMTNDRYYGDDIKHLTKTRLIEYAHFIKLPVRNAGCKSEIFHSIVTFKDSKRVWKGIINDTNHKEKL